MRISKNQPSNGVHKFTLFFTVAMCMHVLPQLNAEKGFLSIDCGSTRDNYNDSLGLTWVTDTGTYTTTGVPFEQSNVNWTLLNSLAGAGNQALQSFRYYPERRNKYCYDLESELSASYLIRASFYLNAYELGQRRPFQFLTYINANEWFQVSSGDEDTQSDMFVSQEAIFRSPSKVIYFCLVPVFGVPFISSLELRQLEPTMYEYSGSHLEFLHLLFRYNMGPDTSTPEIVRFPDDSYDRIWQRAPLSDPTINSFSNSTRANKNSTWPKVNYVPSKVMQDCWLSVSNRLTHPFDIYTPEVYLTGLEYAYTLVYFENLDPSVSTPFEMEISFDVGYDYYTDGATDGGTVTVSNQASMQASHNLLLAGSMIEVDLSTTSELTQGPLNAFEAYAQLNYNFSATDAVNVNVTNYAKSFLSLTDWHGDPCLPVPYDWISCTCSNCDERGQEHLLTKYVITSINLSNLPAGALATFYSNDPGSRDSNGFSSLERMALTNSEINNSAFTGIVRDQYLSNIAYLDVSFNAISIIPPASGWLLHNIISLNLSHNHLTKLDPFENYEAFETKLNILDLSHNDMTSIPATWVNTTKNLTFLDLSHNQLEGAISSLNQLIQINRNSIQELNVSNNKLSGTFSSSLYFSGLPSLAFAIFDQNSISGILNLSLWLEMLQKTASENLTSSNALPLFSFVNNTISDIFPSAQAFEDLQQKHPFLFFKGILLGGNPYCIRAKSYIQRYLCRSNLNDTVPERKNHNRDITILGIWVGVLLFVICTCCVTSASLWKLWRQVYALREIQQALADQKVQPPFYKYNDLKIATRSFHNDNKLGQGGFGAVYKGELEDGTMLAVKKLFNSQTLQVLEEFLNEVVLITGIKHRNLVQLKGCCIKDKERMLVYDYVERGNLAQALWGSNLADGILTWEQRFSICVAVARGLSYLHEELQPSIIHRDIKPENILLDRNLQPKIADFGLARNFSNDSSQALFTKYAAGTFGYCCPEYASLGELSEKVDTYSYGVVVLEVVTGRKCIDNTLPLQMRILKHWVQKMYKQRLLLDILQPELRENCVMAEVIRTIKVGLLCVQNDSRKRPSMSQVVTMFLGNMDVPGVLEENEDDRLDFNDLVSGSELQYSTSQIIMEEDPKSFLFSRGSPSSSGGSSALTPSKSMIEMRARSPSRRTRVA